MNKKILSYYENKIDRILKYLEVTDVRKSLEEYKQKTLRETAKLTSEEWKEHNLAFINDFYATGIEVLKKNEIEINRAINQVLDFYKNLNRNVIVESITAQLKDSIKKWKLNDNYSDFNGLFFEFDDDLDYSGIAFKEDKFNIILDEKQSVEFEDGSYASDYAISFQLKDILTIPNREAFEDFAWEFEYELEIFLGINELFESFVAVCLHKSLLNTSIIQLLESKGFLRGGIIYFNQHDHGEKTVFINE
jgi:hypothetical protein